MKPDLIVLCGLPGSGKTTFAKTLLEHNDNTIWLSSDAIRKELWGDESCQKESEKVFGLMQSRAVKALREGVSVIYDATSLTRKSRRAIVSQCEKIANPICCIVWAPIEVCIERDAARERTVGKSVIDRMVKSFQAPYYDEGFSEIYVTFGMKEDFDYYSYSKKLLSSMEIQQDNPHHTFNVYEHGLAAAEYVIKHSSNDSTLTYAAMYHDVGKPYTKSFVNSKGETTDVAHYYQHQNVGAWMIYGDAVDRVTAAWLISTHMDPYFNTKYYRNLPKDLKEKIDLLHAADVSAH